MRTSHTPGQWGFHYTSAKQAQTEASDGTDGGGASGTVFQGKGVAKRIVAFLPHHRDQKEDKEREANARLIAAAPELLETLQATRDAIQAVLDIPAHEPASVVLLIRRLMEAKGKANDAIRNAVGG